MPCRIDFRCPTCGQMTEKQFPVSIAVQQLEGDFKKLIEHHRETEEAYEKDKHESESNKQLAERAVTGHKAMKQQLHKANEDRNALRSQLSGKLERLKPEVLRKASRAELLEELTRREAEEL